MLATIDRLLDDGAYDEARRRLADQYDWPGPYRRLADLDARHDLDGRLHLVVPNELPTALLVRTLPTVTWRLEGDFPADPSRLHEHRLVGELFPEVRLSTEG